MSVEWVIDASVVAAVLFKEIGSDSARSFLDRELTAGSTLGAPDLMPLEVASIAAKKVWRADVDPEDGRAAVQTALDLIKDNTISASTLALRAHELAAAHHFSAYDACYLALAENRTIRVATLDAKLARRADETGLGHLVHLLT